MKLTTTIFSVLFTLSNLFSQELKYSDMETVKKGEYTSYTASDGVTYKVGDKIKLGFPSSYTNSGFTFIRDSEGQLSANASGQEVEIVTIMVSGHDRIGYKVSFYTYAFGWISRYSVSFENALVTKEVISQGKTSEEALYELKDEKTKLDLEVISPEEYEKRKLELMRFID